MREWWHNFRTSEDNELSRKALGMWLLCFLWFVFLSRQPSDMTFVDKVFLSVSYWMGFMIFYSLSEFIADNVIKKQPDKRVRRDF